MTESLSSGVAFRNFLASQDAPGGRNFRDFTLKALDFVAKVTKFN
jgi:hypothetical protein